MKNLLILSAFILSGLYSKAQNNKQVRDSIYYLLDTANTPANDRMWEIHQENSLVFYMLQCPCLNFGGEPTFVYNIKKSHQTEINRLKGIRLITIVDLLKLIKQSEGEKFNEKHILYLIQPLNRGYTKREVRGFRNQEPIKDYEIIKSKTDTSRNKH